MDEVLEREREFHDRLAATIDPDSLPVELDAVDLDLLARVGDLAGQRVLELGCGTGNLTVEFARAGAEVTALDLSSGMVGIARARVERLVPDARCHYLVGPAESVEAPDASFDVIVGKWILHHTDLERLTPELHRLLAAGGRAVFIENSGLNPILRFSREHLAGRFGVPRYGTSDEHPLLEADFKTFERSFARVERHFDRFDFFVLFDRQVLRYRWPALSRVCAGLDRFVERRMTFMRRFSFRVIVVLAR